MQFKYTLQAWMLSGVMLCLAGVAAAMEETPTLAPGWGELGYELPEPGTYALPIIRQAAGGKVLNTDGDAVDLGDFIGGKITVLSFIYTACNDINGCPLSIFVMHQLQDQLKREPQLADHLRLVSFSFDIKNDTPEVLRAFQQEHSSHATHEHETPGHARHAAEHAEHSHHAGHGADHTQHGGEASPQGADWFFVVAASEEALDPVLKAYSQFVIPAVDENNEQTNQFAHLLRVFLIDKQGRVRNIYSPDFLHPDILLADVKSLLLMDERVSSDRHGQGDDHEDGQG